MKKPNYKADLNVALEDLSEARAEIERLTKKITVLDNSLTDAEDKARTAIGRSTELLRKLATARAVIGSLLEITDTSVQPEEQLRGKRF